VLSGDELTERGWDHIGRRFRLQRVGLEQNRSVQMWAIGDWLVRGEDCLFRNRKRAAVRTRAAQLTGYARRTLAMAASVSRKVEPSARVETLTWWHHLAVAKLAHEDQIDWLERALHGEWTATNLRRELADEGLTNVRGTRNPVRSLLMELVKLRGDDLSGEMRAELTAWWTREFGILDGDDVAADRH
jgi:hypothetical protein